MTQPEPRRILRQHVQTDQLLGVEAVPFRAAATVAAAVVPVAVTLPVAVTPAHVVPTRPAAPPRAVADPVTVVATPAATASPRMSQPCLVKASDYPTIELAERLKILTDINEQQVRSCTRCELHLSRTNTVFGEGNIQAAVMFVGEGPGQTEDETGRPFVGRAGELLDKMIVAMGLSRDQVYIANTVKCRPPNNRTPTPMEVETCSTFLLQQIATIQPRVLVALGGPASKFLLQTQTGITALRGSWYEFSGLVRVNRGPVIPVMPTFHPAYLLRAYTPENRKKVWSDLQQVMELLKASQG